MITYSIISFTKSYVCMDMIRIAKCLGPADVDVVSMFLSCGTIHFQVVHNFEDAKNQIIRPTCSSNWHLMTFARMRPFLLSG